MGSQTKVEMDWLLYLANKGVSVPFPLETRNGTLAVSMEENSETYIISAFSMAEGQYWDKTIQIYGIYRPVSRRVHFMLYSLNYLLKAERL